MNKAKQSAVWAVALQPFYLWLIVDCYWQGLTGFVWLSLFGAVGTLALGLGALLLSHLRQRRASQRARTIAAGHRAYKLYEQRQERIRKLYE